MQRLYGPDSILQAYFILLARVASCRALVMDGMPHIPGAFGTPAQLRAKLGDRAWYVQDLTDQEKQLVAARLLGFGGMEGTYRYVLTLGDLQADERPTGARHPGDQRFREVRGTQVRQPTLTALAEHFGLPLRDVRTLVRSARAKVADRMALRPPRRDDDDAGER
jgi:hypothetical protein